MPDLTPKVWMRCPPSLPYCNGILLIYRILDTPEFKCWFKWLVPVLDYSSLLAKTVLCLLHLLWIFFLLINLIQGQCQFLLSLTFHLTTPILNALFHLSSPKIDFCNNLNFIWFSSLSTSKIIFTLCLMSPQLVYNMITLNVIGCPQLHCATHNTMYTICVHLFKRNTWPF